MLSNQASTPSAIQTSSNNRQTFFSICITNNTKFAPTLYWIIICLLYITDLNKILFSINIYSFRQLHT